VAAGGGAALSSVPLVCECQKQKAGLVVELFVGALKMKRI
jgi:hypothetical protein